MKNERGAKGGCLGDTRGLATVEYVLIACLVAIVGFGAFKALGHTMEATVGAATATIGQLPSASDDAGTTTSGSASTMGSGAAPGLGDVSGGAGGDCESHVASGGGAGAPCNPSSFGSCVGGGDTTVVISCSAATGLTVAH